MCVRPAGFLRALASKQVQVDGDDDDDAGSEAGDDAAKAAAAAKTTADNAAAGSRGGGGQGGTLKQAVVVDLSSARRKKKLTFWQRYNPLRLLVPDTMGIEGLTKKRLLRNATDTWRGTLPIVLWGVLVIALYAFCISQLVKISEPLKHADIGRRVQVRPLPQPTPTPQNITVFLKVTWPELPRRPLS